MKIQRIQRTPFEILAVPVLSDNFVYLVCRNRAAILIDAGEAGPIRKALENNNLQLTQILITHRHADHTAALPELRSAVTGKEEAVGTVEALAVPGHTAGDTAWYFPEAGALFTGDCLINGACGRPMDGTAAQLYDSLQKIKQLPDETLILGGHDYLDENLRFGLTVEPDNADLRARLELYRTDPAAALFVTLAEEKKTNVFLRVASGEEFAALRTQKDKF
jgi:hydroxyacylglutathione hydrolase